MIDKEEFKKQLIEDKLFRADGRFNPAWLTNRSKNYDCWDELEGDTIIEKVYLLFNERKYCIICGKPTKFRNYTLGYTTTCSKECKKIFDSNTLKEASKQCQSDSAKAKRQKTLEEKYGKGITNVFQAESIKNKIKFTNIERYGVEHPAQNANIVKKSMNTQFEKYGDWYVNTREYKESYENTCLQKYGSKTYFSSEDFNTRKKQYLIDNNVSSNMKIPSVIDKYLSTMNHKYGVDYPMQNMEIRKKSLGKQELSSPERKLEYFLLNRGFDFKEQYIVNNKCFDFAIFKDNELSILIEVDGEYYHGLIEDPNDKHVKGFTDNERFLNVPDSVKFIVVDSKRVEESFSTILEVFDISYEEWIQKIIDSLPKEFPYKEYSNKRMLKDYEHLKN